MCADVLPVLFVLLCCVGLWYEARSRRFPNPDVPDARDRMWTQRWLPESDLGPVGVRYQRRAHRAGLLAGFVVFLMLFAC